MTTDPLYQNFVEEAKALVGERARWQGIAERMWKIYKLEERLSDEPDDYKLPKENVIECAILLIATDSALLDGDKAENAVTWARNLYDNSHGPHDGDCTFQPCTCTRCYFECFYLEALERYFS